MTTPGYYRLLELVDELEALASVDTTEDAITELSPQALVDLFDQLDRAKAALATLTDPVTQALRTRLDTAKTYPAPSGTGVLKFSGGSPKWSYDNGLIVGQLPAAIARKYGLDRVVDTDGQARAADDALREVVQALVSLVGAGTPSFSSWRSRAAADLGIDVTKYRHEDGATPVTPKIERI